MNIEGHTGAEPGKQPGGGAARLSLYIAGGANPSEAARETLRAVLEEMEIDALCLEIVDILKTPERALSDQIFVTPTLISRENGARKILIGDLRDVIMLKRFLST